MSLTRLVKDTVCRLLGLHSHLGNDAYVRLARRKGASIGDGTRFFGEKKLDLTEAALIEIGENCVITDRVRVLVHAWDRPLLKRRFGADEVPAFSRLAPVTLGDNVFVGEHSTILPGTEIGDDVIIGAGSVVSSDVSSDSVAAGNPCEVICSLEEYCERRVETEGEELETYVDLASGVDTELGREVREHLRARRSE